MSEGKTPTAAEMPVEAIIEAAKTFSECALKVSRRNQKGTLEMILSNQLYPVADLVTVDDYLDKLCGGGQYRVEPRNPNGTEPIYVVPPFNVVIGGTSRPRPTLQAAAAQQAQTPMINGFPAPQMQPAYAPQLYGSPPPFDPNAMAYPQQQLAPQMPPMMMPPGYNIASPWGAPAARFSSDQIALSQSASLERELGKLREEAKAEREKRDAAQRQHEEKLALLAAQHEREMAEERRRREEERARQEDQRRADERARQDQALAQIRADMQMQLAAIQQASAAPKGPDMMSTLAPLVTAYLASSQNSEASKVSTQIEMMKMQNTSQQQMMQMFMKSSNGDKDQFELLKMILEQRGPDMQMQLMNGMLENQITSLGAMANLIKETAPEEPPIWMQAAMHGVSTVQNIAREVLEANRAKAAGPQQIPSTNAAVPQLAQPQFHQMAAPTAVPGMYTPGDQVDGAPVVLDANGQIVHGAPAQSGSNGSPISPEVQAAVAQQVDAMAPMLPADFQTLEWRAILIALHAQAPVEYSAHLLSRHLGHLMEFRGLPQAFREFPTNPKAVLFEMLSFLPIGQQQPAYAKQVIETAVGYLQEEGYLPGEGDEESAEPEEGGDEQPSNGGLAHASGFSVIPSRVEAIDDSAQLRGRA